MRIRPESPADVGAVRALNEAAFESREEADVVDALRASANGFLSLVASEGDTVVGQVTFSCVSLDGDFELGLSGLGPMAVLPSRQREGIGTRLIHAGLDRCASLGCPAVVVVGHADYYPRFGFVRASEFGLRCEFEVPDDVFMAREISPGALEGHVGLIRYHPAFGGG